MRCHESFQCKFLENVETAIKKSYEFCAQQMYPKFNITHYIIKSSVAKTGKSKYLKVTFREQRMTGLIGSHEAKQAGPALTYLLSRKVNFK